MAIVTFYNCDPKDAGRSHAAATDRATVIAMIVLFIILSLIRMRE